LETLVLTAKDVAQVIEIDAVVEAVEKAFFHYGKGEAIMPPKVYLTLKQFGGDFRAMPAYLEGSAAVKWVSVYPENPKQGLPTVIGTIILSDPRTGFPLAIIDGTLITEYRTGAASAVASKYLARKDSQSLGLVGCGALAQTHLEAIGHLFDLKVVRVYNRSADKIKTFIDKNKGFNIEGATIEEVTRSDIVCTLTTVTSPLVFRPWVKPGTHINAVGADAPGKQELDSTILNNAKVVVDELVQATHGGEINVPVREGLFKKEDIYGTLGEIVAGKKSGRDDKEITVFDSTGLAIQDVAVARAVYEAALTQKIGHQIELIP